MMPTRRDDRLDGLRGLAAAGVLVSHYLAEIPGGSTVFAVGFVSVTVFFVMSGFLVGRLILERAGSSNFFAVFYARRLLRTVPSYALVLGLVALATALASGRPWMPHFGEVPVLSYATFTQNVAMASAGTMGHEWLSPSWTLAVEEQFYLLAPLAIVVLPRPLLALVLVLAAGAAVYARMLGTQGGEGTLWHLCSLLGRADALALGVGAAVLSRRMTGGPRLDRVLEVVPLAAVVALPLLVLAAGRDWTAGVAMSFALALAAAAFMLRLVFNPAASPWLAAPALCRIGHQSYSLYLVHMPVLGLVHGLALGAPPTLSTPAGWLATLLALPVTVLLSLALTRFVEEPATALGRRFRWAEPAAAIRPAAA